MPGVHGESSANNSRSSAVTGSMSHHRIGSTVSVVISTPRPAHPRAAPASVRRDRGVRSPQVQRRQRTRDGTRDQRAKRGPDQPLGDRPCDRPHREIKDRRDQLRARTDDPGGPEIVRQLRRDVGRSGDQRPDATDPTPVARQVDLSTSGVGRDQETGRDIASASRRPAGHLAEDPAGQRTLRLPIPGDPPTAASATPSWLGTPCTGSESASPNACAVAMPTRSPVNGPGPRPTTTASRSTRVEPARSRASRTNGIRYSA